MENKIYIAKYKSTALSNNRRYFEAYPYRCIGKAIKDAQEEITKQQTKNPGFVGTEIVDFGEHGVVVKPKYEGTDYDNKAQKWITQQKKETGSP